ncbi:hypothetical protein MCOR04_010687, partial [Pyricularia oryzae]
MNGLKKDFTVRFPSEISVGVDAGKRFNRIKAGKIFFHGRSAIYRGAVLKGFFQDLRPDQDNSPVKVTSTISRSSI